MFCRGGFYARPAACGVALYGRFAKRPYEAARTIMDAVGNMAEDRKNKGSDEAPFVCVLHNALGSREGCPYRFLFRSFL
jgi:hypothetical protein